MQIFCGRKIHFGTVHHALALSGSGIGYSTSHRGVVLLKAEGTHAYEMLLKPGLWLLR